MVSAGSPLSSPFVVNTEQLGQGENIPCTYFFRRDQQGVTRKCDLDYLLNPDFGKMAIYLDDRQVLIVSSETKGQLICGSKPPVKTRIENYAKLAIGCDCAFQNVRARIPYSLRACQTRVADTLLEHRVTE